MAHVSDTSDAQALYSSEPNPFHQKTARNHGRCSEITIKGPKKQPETKLHMFGVHFWDL